MNRPAGLAVVGVVAAATLAGLGMRLASAPLLVRDGLHLWYDPDSSYHMLRVERTLAQFPQVPSFDPDTNAPEGFRCGIFSDGTLAINAEDGQITLSEPETRAMFKYLDRVFDGAEA